MGELDGKVALVTGGARGQGAAEARIFAREGATVVITDVLDEAGEQTAGELGCEYHHLDVTSEVEWESVVADVVARHGRLDILMNNAGIFKPAQLLNTSTEMWNQTVAINQTGVFLGMRTVAKAMVAAGNGGSIINTSSIAGLEGGFGATAYGATKWAVTGMTRTAAKELGKHSIRVNSIHPGAIVTDMITNMLEGGRDEKMIARQPIKRLGTPEDIAEMALFLASDRSSYCTGQQFTVDGGVHG
ncbi:MAG: SDR family oxidoreductase [Acidimicrobiia bacterium]|nr:SDR family oxidoreductase [Acidimicrobiia bacterium]MDH4364139.1 SDR family oxidoreductase [Acidimicrobiia bacterium]MDH5290245.1 SDR family oxidoreductase [Acidimicrobiia bacterium]